jgi:hypothetical protein
MGYYMIPFSSAPGGDDSESEPEEDNDDGNRYDEDGYGRWKEYYDDSYDTYSDSAWSDSNSEDVVMLCNG